MIRSKRPGLCLHCLLTKLHTAWRKAGIRWWGEAAVTPRAPGTVLMWEVSPGPGQPPRGGAEVQRRLPSRGPEVWGRRGNRVEWLKAVSRQRHLLSPPSSRARALLT